MHPMETKTASGATNTESGKPNESEHSVPDIEEKVKRAKVEDPFPTASESREAPPLDLRTEMFMLNEVKEILEDHFCIDSTDKFSIISRLISACEDVNEA